MDLKGKVVAITGGGGGIGRTASYSFSKYGADVVILELNEAAGKETADDINAKGGKALFIKTDVSSYESVRAAFDIIAEKYGRLDALYNNASVFLGGKDNNIADVEPDIWHKVIAINLDSIYYCSKCAIPLMKEKGGSIINTASSAAVVGVPGCAAYTATKGATAALTREMAVDFGKYNIRTNCIAPAAIQSEMVKESNLSDPEFDNEFFIRRLTPIGRWGKPNEVAELACFLASDEAAYLNGNVIRADGGITINGNVNK
ncbi:MAG: SDR family oxidoreductase [Clostridia bacterium]|nr:SDR family oxidoreductase [Clostridia bacterium]